MKKLTFTLILSALIIFSTTQAYAMEDISREIYASETPPGDGGQERTEYSGTDYAEEVWAYFTGLGYSEYVTAGMLGNMMVECGGYTLELQPEIYDAWGQGYGICQWLLIYTPEADGLDITGQLELLEETLESNMKVFGGSYKYFTALTDAGAAAEYFMKYYERGEGAEARKRCAYTAYEYFKS